MTRLRWLLLLVVVALCAAPARESQGDTRLKKAFRRPEQNGWIFVHLEGTPAEIGFQHGYLLASEIADADKVIVLGLTHDSQKDYGFFRAAAEKVLWPHIEAAISRGAEGHRRGTQGQGRGAGSLGCSRAECLARALALLRQLVRPSAPDRFGARPVPEHCSAFVATGSYTTDGKVVIAHNNWTGYTTGSRWNIIFDIAPAQGYRILMDGMPGLIHSGDDFGVNSRRHHDHRDHHQRFRRLRSRTAFRSSCGRARPCSMPLRSTISRAS